MKTKKQTKKTVYEYTDKVIRIINAMMVVQFSALSITDFDELNILDSVNKTYSMVDTFVRSEFVKLYSDAYNKAAKRIKADNSRSVDGTDAVVSIINSVNPITHYIYANEYDRKRTRCYESLMSTVSKDVRKMLKMRAMTILSRQVREFCNYVTYQGMLNAYKDNGIKRVRWIALEDDKICEECDDLNGLVFDIDRVPIKPHINCRCWLEPIWEVPSD